jgi:hypothetical protein
VQNHALLQAVLLLEMRTLQALGAQKSVIVLTVILRGIHH